MTMANGGGLVLDRVSGTLRCPVAGCHWCLRVTDLGELVDLGVSEDDIRGHLATHPVEDWLRTLSSHQTTIRGLITRVEAGEERARQLREATAHRESRLRHERDQAKTRLVLGGLCLGCGETYSPCVARQDQQGPCCPDCTHHPEAEPDVGYELMRRCCAEQTVSELADTLVRELGDSDPDDEETAAKAREHLAETEADHARHG